MGEVGGRTRVAGEARPQTELKSWLSYEYQSITAISKCNAVSIKILFVNREFNTVNPVF